MSLSPLSYFHPLVAKWFTEAVGSPTDVQVRTWPEISGGNHVLVSAPTGSGKTLAAFLWGLDRLITGAWTGGHVRMLYVSPLKALNNDVQKNLLKPLAALRGRFAEAGEPFPDITVLTRSGDTPGGERRRMARRPPEILITTPESLNLLLTSKSGRAMLTDVATVILDEIHAVAGTKRGTHLITAVDRLVPLSGEFQRIALSATINPPDRVAAFVGGYRRQGTGADSRYEPRTVSLISSQDSKAYALRVTLSFGPGEKASGDGLWPALTRACKKIIAAHRSTLLFTNSRRTAEKVTRFLNEAEPAELAYAHHGSLSREIRLAVEEKLKKGELRAIVATNSLELGIDIGSLDQVVLIQTPRSVSSALQRIGRAGHGVGETSRGLLFPLHGMDIVEAAVMARAVLDRDIEQVRPVEAPLDVLAQVLLSMTAMEPWDIDDLYAFIRTSAPYHDLPRRHFDLIVEMLAGKYADTRLRELKPRVYVDRMDNTVRAREEAPLLLYSSGGTIPERGYFDLRLEGSRAKIGELDEEFVWERSIGETFTLGSQLWRIRNITHNDVEVVPARSVAGIFPFWRAEEQSRDFGLSERIGRFLEDVDSRLNSPELMRELMGAHALDEGAAEELVRFLRQQREATGSPLPHRHHLLIESVEDAAGRGDTRQVILHTLWGGRVNRPFALALAAAWEERHGTTLQVLSDDNAVSVMLPQAFDAGELVTLVSPGNVERLLRRKLEQTGFFGARFRENAERALLLPKAGFRKRMPLWLIRLRSKSLLEAVRQYEDFPLLIETWRTCLEDEFDLPDLLAVLGEISDRGIRVTERVTSVASPFAGGLAWKQTNAFMYADDTPLLAGESALRPDQVKELLFSAHLRPKIPAELMRMLDARLKRTAEGYAPGSAEELLDWVKERLLVPREDWQELALAIKRDQGADPEAWLAENSTKLAWVSWPGVREPLLSGIETLPRVIKAFGPGAGDLVLEPASGRIDGRELRRKATNFLRTSRETESSLSRDEGASEEDEPAGFLSSWLAFYGPVSKARVQSVLGMAPDQLDRAIEQLVEARELVLDRFGEESTELEICDSRNLEALLRMARRERRPSFEALPLEAIPLFLAQYQGVITRGRSLDDLPQRLEQLFGWPARAAVWEEDLLPARMQPYRLDWLDSLMSSSDLVWFGCGKGRVSLAFLQDLDLFRGPDGEAGDLQELIPDRRGSYSLLEVADLSKLGSAGAAERLWKAAWKGTVTTDSFRAIRKGVQTGFSAKGIAEAAHPVSRRSGFSRWKASRPLEGNWRRIDAPPKEPDILVDEELKKDRVRQLFRRYGVLFRELLVNELPLLQWREIFRSLRLMELSGEVLSGHFFQEVSGLQFTTPEALRMLREPLPEDAVFRLNAADPASLCGVPLEGLRQSLPPRLPTTHLFYHGSRLVVVSKRLGRELEIRASPGDDRFPDYLKLFRELLGREFRPLQKITVEKINDEPALRSPYADALKQAGFRPARAALELWREYS